MLIISILGCCGSLRESHCMLMTVSGRPNDKTKNSAELTAKKTFSQFFCFLLLILVAEIAAGAWAIHNKNVLDDMFRVTVKNTVQNEYGVIQDKTDAFDTFQRQVSRNLFCFYLLNGKLQLRRTIFFVQLECCGASGPNDWALSKYNSKETSNIINMKISSSSMHYKIPESCCKKDIDADRCSLSTKVTLKSIISSDIFSQVRGIGQKKIELTKKIDRYHLFNRHRDVWINWLMNSMQI